MIIKMSVKLFPFMWATLRDVNTFSKKTVDKLPQPKLEIYIPELLLRMTEISVRKIIKTHRKK